MLPVLALLLVFTGYKIISPSRGLEIVYSKDVEGLGVATEVGILDNGRMRVKFTFVNKTDETQTVDVELSEPLTTRTIAPRPLGDSAGPTLRPRSNLPFSLSYYTVISAVLRRIAIAEG